MKITGEGLRYNGGKIRYDLIHPAANEGLARVLTKGAEKYAERNWEAGMVWSKVIQSLKRHLAAIESGEDYDPETGELHIDHLQCNAHFLSAYYRIYPEGDDRTKFWHTDKRWGLDVDEVLADFVGGFYKTFKGENISEQERPLFWHSPFINKHFQKIASDEDFWLSLPPKINPDTIPFEPHCYVTSRPIRSDVTAEWLHNNGFPDRPVITVGHDESKVDAVKNANVTHFVDDRFENFVELNNAGVFTYLIDAPHNRRYNVGHQRIKALSDLR